MNSKIPLFFYLLLLAGLTACSPGKPSESEAEKYFLSQVDKGSQERLRLIFFEKTDGKRAEILGESIYELMFIAKLEFLSNAIFNAKGDLGMPAGEISVSPYGEVSKNVWDQFWENNVAGGVGRAMKGDQLSVTGSVYFEKRESGWVAKGAHLNAEHDTSTRDEEGAKRELEAQRAAAEAERKRKEEEARLERERKEKDARLARERREAEEKIILARVEKSQENATTIRTYSFPNQYFRSDIKIVLSDVGYRLTDTTPKGRHGTDKWYWFGRFGGTVEKSSSDPKALLIDKSYTIFFPGAAECDEFYAAQLAAYNKWIAKYPDVVEAMKRCQRERLPWCHRR